MNLFEELAKLGKLTGSIVMKFQQTYGDLFYRSLDLLQNNAVSIQKNIFTPSQLVVWTVKGRSNDYLVFPEIFCQCKNFLIDNIYRKQTFGLCKHLLAQKLAESLNTYQINQLKDKDYSIWIKKIFP